MVVSPGIVRGLATVYRVAAAGCVGRYHMTPQIQATKLELVSYAKKG